MWEAGDITGSFYGVPSTIDTLSDHLAKFPETKVKNLYFDELSLEQVAQVERLAAQYPGLWFTVARET
jgi:hypothetical protein